MTAPSFGQRIDAVDLADIKAQLNAILERIGNGALQMRGIKLSARAAAPSDAPGAGDPNIVVVIVGGVAKLYIWTGAAWVVVGTQT